MVVILVVSMTAAFLLVGSWYVAAEHRRKPPTRGDYVDFSPRPIQIGRRKWL